jgi:hypothetical protein
MVLPDSDNTRNLIRSVQAGVGSVNRRHDPGPAHLRKETEFAAFPRQCLMVH